MVVASGNGTPDACPSGVAPREKLELVAAGAPAARPRANPTARSRTVRPSSAAATIGVLSVSEDPTFAPATRALLPFLKASPCPGLPFPAEGPEATSVPWQDRPSHSVKVLHGWVRPWLSERTERALVPTMMVAPWGDHGVSGQRQARKASPQAKGPGDARRAQRDADEFSVRCGYGAGCTSTKSNSALTSAASAWALAAARDRRALPRRSMV